MMLTRWRSLDQLLGDRSQDQAPATLLGPDFMLRISGVSEYSRQCFIKDQIQVISQEKSAETMQ